MSTIEEIRAGNKTVMKQIFTENAYDVYNFAKEITGTNEAALKAVKSSFEEVFRRIGEGETPENLRIFILKIAHEEAFSIAADSLLDDMNIAQVPSIELSGEEDIPSREFPDLKDDAELSVESSAEKGKIKTRKGAAVVILDILLIICCIVLVWVVIGFLENLNVIPDFNLGYNWFDQNICPLFNL